MLCIGETPREAMQFCQQSISISRNFIKSMRHMRLDMPNLQIELDIAIAREQLCIGENLLTIRQLGKYRRDMGMDYDEPYRPKSTPEGIALAKSQQIDIDALLKGLDGK